MQIKCDSCSNHRDFVIPLWVRATFKINEDGTLSILHTKQLESIEEKLSDQGKTSYALTCQECSGDAEVVFNEYAKLDTAAHEKLALEGL